MWLLDFKIKLWTGPGDPRSTADRLTKHAHTFLNSVKYGLLNHQRAHFSFIPTEWNKLLPINFVFIRISSSSAPSKLPLHSFSLSPSLFSSDFWSRSVCTSVLVSRELTKRTLKRVMCTFSSIAFCYFLRDHFVRWTHTDQRPWSYSCSHVAHILCLAVKLSVWFCFFLSFFLLNNIQPAPLVINFTFFSRWTNDRVISFIIYIYEFFSLVFFFSHSLA